MSTQALTTKDLFNFRGQFNGAWLKIAQAAGLTTLTERGTESLPKSRVEFTFTVGDAANQVEIPGIGLVYDFFEGCRMSMRICTPRPDQPSPLPDVITLHDEWTATVYSVLEERLRPFDPYLPFYQVVKILPRPSSVGIDPAFLEDWTRLEFEVWFGIRPAAWPTSMVG